MNYKIAVCDDSAPDRTFLYNLVKNWAQTHRHHVQLLEFVSAENFLFFYEEEKDFDILLLDIEMNGMDGVTMAKSAGKIRRFRLSLLPDILTISQKVMRWLHSTIS